MLSSAAEFAGDQCAVLQVLQHYKDKVAHIVADKSADEVASQIQQAVQQ